MAGRSLGPNRAQQLLRDVAPLADHIWFLLYDTALYATALYDTALYDTDTPSAHCGPAPVGCPRLIDGRQLSHRSATTARRADPPQPPWRGRWPLR